MRSVRKLTRTGLATLGVLVGGLMLTAAPALATEHWRVLGSFGLAPADPAPLSDPAGLAVNQSTGNVYVVDKGNDRVEWFDSAGKYEGQFNGGATPAKAFSEAEGVAVDNDPRSPSFGDVYVIDEGHSVVDKFGASGAYLGQLTGACEKDGESPPQCSNSKFVPFIELDGVAVDANGVVWVESSDVGGYGDPAIDKFSGKQPSAFLSSRISQAGVLTARGLAVDSEDNLYVIYHSGKNITRLNSLGEVPGEEGRENLGGVEGASGVAVDSMNNYAYIDTGTSIAVIDPAESLVESFGGGLSGAESLAINPAAGASGYVYVVEPADNEVLFLEHSETPPPPPAAPKTNPSTEITSSSATLNGELNPKGAAGGVGYYFSYHAGASSSCTEPGSVTTILDNVGLNLTGNSPVSVSATVTGLEPNLEYVYCLVADGFGATPGSSELVKTPAAAPEVIGESALSVEIGNVRFEATINPNHSKGETTYLFEYSKEGSVKDNTLGGVGGAIETVGGSGAIPAGEFGEFHGSAVAEELGTGGNSVYYRVAATNETGTTYGKVELYTTDLPVVSSRGFSGSGLTSVILNAEVYPDGFATKYGFEYATNMTILQEGKGTKVFSATEIIAGGEFGEAPTPVELQISGLTPYEHYYYRVIAENGASRNPKNANEGRPIVGEIREFETRSLAFPTTGEASNIGLTSVVLSGSVIAPFVPASGYYEFISEAGYQAAIAKHASNPYAEGETSASVGVQASESPQTAGPVQVGGLLPETTYRYRLVGKNEFGWKYGADLTFRTASKVLPVVSTGAAGAVSQNSATLSGTVSTSGLQTNYGFEIGTEPGSYGPATGLGSIGGSQTETVSVRLGELQPGTTYYYRVTATNADGTVPGQPVSFATPSFPVLLTPQVSPPLIAFISPAFPAEEKGSGVSTKTLTNAQKLANALKACKKDKNKHKRASCEKQAHKKYGVATKKKK